ncbi:EH signature domain-containing protein [Vulgatibacter incomptus]|uniref:EH signature domain-containing protein n=1 Tax=Vulgatibacter incomptus TaxID=1391653 RepID=UPI0014703B92|nr:EH signature domain-containing protein [Vulgatibacter incomptus]
MKAFLRDYPQAAPTFDEWRLAIDQLLRDSASPQGIAWRERNETWKLLEADGPGAFADQLWRRSDGIPVLLEGAGFTDDLQNARFVHLVADALLDRLGRELSRGLAPTSPAAQRVVAMAVGAGQFPYPSLRTKLPGALLGPYVDRDPDEAGRKWLERLFLDYYGDPRIDTSRWFGVDERHRGVMHRWLVRQSLEAFFRVLDGTADKRHWDARRAFWGKYFDAGVVVQAWVVFGLDAYRIATGRLNMDGRQFGTVHGEQDQSKSVLLMQIRGPRGSVDIAEWSHMGRCRGWPSGGSGAPQFYRRRYDGWDLRGEAPLEQTHYAGGSWMPKVREWIGLQTGLRV